MISHCISAWAKEFLKTDLRLQAVSTTGRIRTTRARPATLAAQADETYRSEASDTKRSIA